ncbi:MAG: hypothetical protein CL758_03340 [Chloroflexi bacterium]|nr:hypothetical protein [Chloroflexota bacterium]
MQKFVFVITSIMVLSLIACNGVVGQGTGSDQNASNNQQKDEINSPEENNAILLQTISDLDQYNQQLRADIEQMQKDLQQEIMINNVLQEDITNLSNELQKQQQTLLDSAGPSVEELLDAEILTTYIKSSLVEIYNNSQGDQVKFMTEVEKVISELNNIMLGQGDINSLSK